METRNDWRARRPDVRAPRSKWIISWSEQSRCDFARLITGAEQALGSREQVSVAVLEQNSPYWQRVLSTLPPEHVAEQPLDRGSAPGILLAFLRIFHRNPAAQVALVSASSHFAEPGLLQHAIELAEDVQLHDPGRIVAISPPGVYSSARERIAAATREGLCLASTPVLLGLFQRARPELLASFLERLSGEALFDPNALDAIYPFLPLVDFGRHVLANDPDLVRIVEPSSGQVEPVDPWRDPGLPMDVASRDPIFDPRFVPAFSS